MSIGGEEASAPPVFTNFGQNAYHSGKSTGDKLFIEAGYNATRRFILKSLKITFIRNKNCKPFCFSCNLSAFISQFQRLHIWALCNFFGQKNSPAPQVRICPYAYVYELCLLFLSRVTGHCWCCIYCLSFHKIKKTVRSGGVQDATHCFQLFQPSWLKKLLYQTKLLGFFAIKYYFSNQVGQSTSLSLRLLRRTIKTTPMDYGLSVVPAAIPCAS